MSKFILWAGFILSIPMLFLAIANIQSGKPIPFFLWAIIFLGSGYKLFFSQPKR